MAREYTTNQQRVQHQWDDCNNILLQELSRISNITGQCRCSSCIWGSQIDLTFLVSHSAREVPVRSWNTNLHNQRVNNGVNTQILNLITYVESIQKQPYGRWTTIHHIKKIWQYCLLEHSEAHIFIIYKDL